jgi:clan AA aspartic protease
MVGRLIFTYRYGYEKEAEMGLTFIEGTVTGAAKKQRQLNFLVDSGASYTLLPYDVWNDIGLTPKRKADFILADGTKMERMISECHISIEGADGHTPVILGEKGDDALIGVVTLENLGLVLDPFKRTLHAMHLRLV